MSDGILSFDQAAGSLLILDGITGLPKGIQNARGETLFGAATGPAIDSNSGVAGSVGDVLKANVSSSGTWGSGAATLGFVRISTDGGTDAPPLAITNASYAKASLPSATHVGQQIYVNNATGAHVTGSLAFWNGTNWIDVTTGVAIV